MKLCTRFSRDKEAVYRNVTARKNRAMEKKFAAVPFPERIVLVPHCLRNADKCRAADKGSYYLCVQCGACSIAVLQKKARELGYKGLFILKGGRTVEKLVAEYKPQALLGVACHFEGAQGMEQSEKARIPVQFISLTRDGCVNTEVNTDDVVAVMSRENTENLNKKTAR